MIDRKIFVGTVFMLFAMFSCSEGEVFYRFHHLDRERWYKDSLLVFTMDSAVLTPGKLFDLTIELSANRGYPYRDLWLRVDHNLTDTLIKRDTLHIELADRDGKWLGSGTGGLNHLSVPYLRQILPTVRDSMAGYSVVIAHIMNDNPLRGIERVGLIKEVAFVSEKIEDGDREE